MEGLISGITRAAPDYQFDQIVCDFIHDRSGAWYMTQVKTFTLTPTSWRIAAQAGTSAHAHAQAGREALGDFFDDSAVGDTGSVIEQSAAQRAKELKKLSKKGEGRLCPFCRLRFHPTDTMRLPPNGRWALSDASQPTSGGKHHGDSNLLNDRRVEELNRRVVDIQTAEERRLKQEAGKSREEMRARLAAIGAVDDRYEPSRQVYSKGFLSNVDAYEHSLRRLGSRKSSKGDIRVTLGMGDHSSSDEEKGSDDSDGGKDKAWKLPPPPITSKSGASAEQMGFVYKTHTHGHPGTHVRPHPQDTALHRTLSRERTKYEKVPPDDDLRPDDSMSTLTADIPSDVLSAIGPGEQQGGGGAPQEGLLVPAFGYTMTMRMMYDTVQQLKERSKVLPCYEHILNMQLGVNPAQYEPLAACRLCYEVYTGQLRLQKVADEFSMALCVPPQMELKAIPLVSAALANPNPFEVYRAEVVLQSAREKVEKIKQQMQLAGQTDTGPSQPYINTSPTSQHEARSRMPKMSPSQGEGGAALESDSDPTRALSPSALQRVTRGRRGSTASQDSGIGHFLRSRQGIRRSSVSSLLSLPGGPNNLVPPSPSAAGERRNVSSNRAVRSVSPLRAAVKRVVAGELQPQPPSSLAIERMRATAELERASLRAAEARRSEVAKWTGKLMRVRCVEMPANIQQYRLMIMFRHVEDLHHPKRFISGRLKTLVTEDVTGATRPGHTPPGYLAYRLLGGDHAVPLPLASSSGVRGLNQVRVHYLFATPDAMQDLMCHMKVLLRAYVRGNENDHARPLASPRHRQSSSRNSRGDRNLSGTWGSANGTGGAGMTASGEPEVIDSSFAFRIAAGLHSYKADQVQGTTRLGFRSFLTEGRTLTQLKRELLLALPTKDLGTMGLAVSVGFVRDGPLPGKYTELYTRGGGVYWANDGARSTLPLPSQWMGAVAHSSGISAIRQTHTIHARRGAIQAKMKAMAAAHDERTIAAESVSDISSGSEDELEGSNPGSQTSGMGSDGATSDEDVVMELGQTTPGGTVGSATPEPAEGMSAVRDADSSYKAVGKDWVTKVKNTFMALVSDKEFGDGKVRAMDLVLAMWEQEQEDSRLRGTADGDGYQGVGGIRSPYASNITPLTEPARFAQQQLVKMSRRTSVHAYAQGMTQQASAPPISLSALVHGTAAQLRSRAASTGRASPGYSPAMSPHTPLTPKLGSFIDAFALPGSAVGRRSRTGSGSPSLRSVTEVPRAPPSPTRLETSSKLVPGEMRSRAASSTSQASADRAMGHGLRVPPGPPPRAHRTASPVLVHPNPTLMRSGTPALVEEDEESDSDEGDSEEHSNSKDATTEKVNDDKPAAGQSGTGSKSTEEDEESGSGADSSYEDDDFEGYSSDDFEPEEGDETSGEGKAGKRRSEASKRLDKDSSGATSSSSPRTARPVVSALDTGSGPRGRSQSTLSPSGQLSDAVSTRSRSTSRSGRDPPPPPLSITRPRSSTLPSPLPAGRARSATADSPFSVSRINTAPGRSSTSSPVGFRAPLMRSASTFGRGGPRLSRGSIAGVPLLRSSSLGGVGDSGGRRSLRRYMPEAALSPAALATNQDELDEMLFEEYAKHSDESRRFTVQELWKVVQRAIEEGAFLEGGAARMPTDAAWMKTAFALATLWSRDKSAGSLSPTKRSRARPGTDAGGRRSSVPAAFMLPTTGMGGTGLPTPAHGGMNGAPDAEAATLQLELSWKEVLALLENADGPVKALFRAPRRRNSSSALGQSAESGSESSDEDGSRARLPWDVVQSRPRQQWREHIVQRLFDRIQSSNQGRSATPKRAKVEEWAGNVEYRLQRAGTALDSAALKQSRAMPVMVDVGELHSYLKTEADAWEARGSKLGKGHGPGTTRPKRLTSADTTPAEVLKFVSAWLIRDETLRAVFTKYDEDGGGVISWDEFITIVHDAFRTIAVPGHVLSGVIPGPCKRHGTSRLYVADRWCSRCERDHRAREREVEAATERATAFEVKAELAAAQARARRRSSLGQLIFPSRPTSPSTEDGGVRSQGGDTEARGESTGDAGKGSAMRAATDASERTTSKDTEGGSASGVQDDFIYEDTADSDSSDSDRPPKDLRVRPAGIGTANRTHSASSRPQSAVRRGFSATERDRSPEPAVHMLQSIDQTEERRLPSGTATAAVRELQKTGTHRPISAASRLQAQNEAPHSHSQPHLRRQGPGNAARSRSPLHETLGGEAGATQVDSDVVQERLMHPRTATSASQREFDAVQRGAWHDPFRYRGEVGPLRGVRPASARYVRRSMGGAGQASGVRDISPVRARPLDPVDPQQRAAAERLSGGKSSEALASERWFSLRRNAHDGPELPDMPVVRTTRRIADPSEDDEDSQQGRDHHGSGEETDVRRSGSAAGGMQSDQRLSRRELARRRADRLLSRQQVGSSVTHLDQMIDEAMQQMGPSPFDITPLTTNDADRTKRPRGPENRQEKLKWLLQGGAMGYKGGRGKARAKQKSASSGKLQDLSVNFERYMPPPALQETQHGALTARRTQRGQQGTVPHHQDQAGAAYDTSASRSRSRARRRKQRPASARAAIHGRGHMPSHRRGSGQTAMGGGPSRGGGTGMPAQDLAAVLRGSASANSVLASVLANDALSGYHATQAADAARWDVEGQRTGQAARQQRHAGDDRGAGLSPMAVVRLLHDSREGGGVDGVIRSEGGSRTAR